MSKNITTIEKSAIEYLCKLINQTVSLPSEIISDINLGTNQTFSSVRIDTLLKTLKTDCNDYTDKLVSNLSRLELKIVTNEADINKSNILYLYKPDGATSYNQYVVIERNKVLLGTTDISMTDYYTITQADAKFCLLTDYNSLKTAYETHKNDTDIHITSDERTKWNEVDNKANDDEVVKKTDVATSISKTSTDNTIPSAGAVYNKSKNKITEVSNGEDIIAYADGISHETVTDTVRIMNATNSPYGVDNKDNDFHYTIYNITDDNFKRIVAYDIRKNDMYMIMKRGGVWGNWIEVCTTNTNDIPVTNISMSSTYTSNANCKYQVVNGVCYIDFMSGTYKLTSNVNGVILATGLPVPRTGQVCTTYVPWSCADASKQVIIFVNGRGELILHANANANATPIFCTFSYPVK